MMMTALVFGNVFAVSAQTQEPTVPLSTPSEVGQTPTPAATVTESATTDAAKETPNQDITSAPETYYDKGDVEVFSGDPEGTTGNSAGEIIFMLVIFLGCLVLVAEAIISFIRKRGR